MGEIWEEKINPFKMIYILKRVTDKYAAFVQFILWKPKNGNIIWF